MRPSFSFTIAINNICDSCCFPQRVLPFPIVVGDTEGLLFSNSYGPFVRAPSVGEVQRDRVRESDLNGKANARGVLMM